jgi:8-oxo-dGTP pyrophosphatase MutT (NUDIX family)
VAGEKPLETARRELAEEIGKQAAEWAQITSFYTSPGFTDERVWLFRAEGLSDCAADDLAGTPDGMAGTPGGDAHAAEDERIEIVPWPRARLWEAIDACVDEKSLIALLWLAARSASGLA